MGLGVRVWKGGLKGKLKIGDLIWSKGDEWIRRERTSGIAFTGLFLCWSERDCGISWEIATAVFYV